MNLHQYKDSKDMERIMLRKGVYTKSLDDIQIEKRIKKIRRLRMIITGKYRLSYFYKSIKGLFEKC